jgi:hypothetical protein
MQEDTQMSENAQVPTEAPSHTHEESNYDFGEIVIGLLAGLVMFGFVYGVMVSLVAIVRVSEAPGWTIQQFMDVIKLVPPEGVSLSGLPAISFNPPTPEPGWQNAYFWYEFVLLNISWMVSLVAGWWGYKKVLSLPSTDSE